MQKSIDLIETIFEKTDFVIMILGIILVILGATGGITAGTFSLIINELVWRILICIVGVLLLGLSLFLVWKETFGERSVHPKKIQMSTWDIDEFEKTLSRATELCMITVSNEDLLMPLLENFKSFVKRGGKIRFLYLKPETNLLEMVAARSTDIDQDISSLKTHYTESLNVMYYIAKSALVKDNVRVRSTKYLHGMVLTLVDPNTPEGVAYVTLNGFGHHYASRPCITLSKKHFPEWFVFLQETFDNMWESPLSEDVNVLEMVN